MSRWVDFRVLKQSTGIEQVLASYHVELQRAGRHQLRGRCPLPTHGSERSGRSFSVDTAKNVWACHSASCCQLRQGRVGGNVLDLVAMLEPFMCLGAEDPRDLDGLRRRESAGRHP